MLALMAKAQPILREATPSQRPVPMMHHPSSHHLKKITSKEPSLFYPLDSTGAISRDGSFDWPKRSERWCKPNAIMLALMAKAQPILREATPSQRPVPMMHHPSSHHLKKITSKEPSLFYPLDSTGAISWDGSFEWPKRSDAITKTRPNDAPPSQPSPHQKITSKEPSLFYLDSTDNMTIVAA